MGGCKVDDEIPLLSWSLHLLGEAEWAGGGRRRAFGSLASAAASAFLLELKSERSSAGRESRLGVSWREALGSVSATPSTCGPRPGDEFIP